MKARTLCLVVLAAVACREEVLPPSGPPPVLFAAVERRNVEDRIEAAGELIARSRATVAAEVDGRVTLVRIDEGEAAAEGQVVAEIDPERRELEVDSARASVSETRAAVQEKERDFRRIERLHAKGAASDARLDQARTEFARARSRHDAARSRLGVAERALRDASVAAPFSGLIAQRLVSVGEYVRVGTPLFELVALDPVEVEFRVAEVDSARIRQGDTVDVRLAPYPDEIFEAQVTVVSPTIDSRTRTLSLKAAMANPEGRLRPGLFARVEIGVDERSDVLMVPEEAVLQRADGPVVFRLVGEDTVERLSVELGVFREGSVEVRRGLSPGDWVVARGHAGLVDGARVSPRDEAGTPLVVPGARSLVQDDGR